MQQYTFNLYNSFAVNGTLLSLRKLLPYSENTPVILCIGSDLSVGDSLGPICGTMLKENLRGLNCYVYGTLSRPITAHEVSYMNEFFKQTHPGCPVIAIDAAVGSAVKPGSGANKKLSRVGDVAIMGIIAEKSVFNFSILTATRLNIVYKMAEIISEGVSTFIMDSIRHQAARSNQKGAV